LNSQWDEGNYYIRAYTRYANDANGFQKVKGVTNNCIYVIDGLKVFVESTKDIPAGAEILVTYGKEYWQVMRKNIKIDEIEKKKAKKEI
jgi:hypothetical protein